MMSSGLVMVLASWWAWGRGVLPEAQLPYFWETESVTLVLDRAVRDGAAPIAFTTAGGVLMFPFCFFVFFYPKHEVLMIQVLWSMWGWGMGERHPGGQRRSAFSAAT